MVLLRNLLGGTMRNILVVLLCLLVACPSDIALSIDVNGELKNALLEKQSSPPTGYEGRIYYNTTSKLPEFYNGTAWTSLGSMASEHAAGLIDRQIKPTIVPLTFSFNNGGGSVQVDAVFSRIGNTVTVFVPDAQATTGTASNSFSSGPGSIPAWATPATSRIIGVARGRNNGSADTTLYPVRVTETGAIMIHRGNEASTWTNSASGGTQGIGFSGSYFVE